MEAKRQLDLLNQTLKQRKFIAGDSYSISDIAIWAWYGQLVLGDLYEGSAEFLAAFEYQYLQTWAEQISQRSAVKRGLRVNSTKEGGVKERHKAEDLA